ncbi:MAG: ATP-binding cassette domain-containing protein [Microbacteriaceae bacterium]|nr:ATP-binding cassette domain-containing protein [Microbacteriaceae bacterium]
MSARDLSIEYSPLDVHSRIVAVHGVSFDLAFGETLGIIGASGSGKSTLAQILAGRAHRSQADGAFGWEPPSAASPVAGSPGICGGSLTVLGTSLRYLRAAQRTEFVKRVGYLPQDGAQRLTASFTVEENVAEPMLSLGRQTDRRMVGQRVATLIDAVHLPLAVLERRPWELSSGQRQRVALARALILEPELLVADEPTIGVDLTMRRDILRIIPELQAVRSFSAIVVSHDLAVVTEVSDRIAVLSDGMIVALDTLDALFLAPDHPYLKSLAEVVAEQS